MDVHEAVRMYNDKSYGDYDELPQWLKDRAEHRKVLVETVKIDVYHIHKFPGSILAIITYFYLAMKVYRILVVFVTLASDSQLKTYSGIKSILVLL